MMSNHQAHLAIASLNQTVGDWQGNEDRSLEAIRAAKDSGAKLQKFADDEHLAFPLLSDPDLAVHNAYGTYGEKSMYGKTVMGVIRSTFVIDEKGTLEHALYNVKATGHVASLRKKLGLD